MFSAKPILHGLSDPRWFWFVLATAVASIVMIVILLQYERKLVSGKVGLTLLLMRLSVIIVVFLTLLQPVISWELDRATSDRIIVAVDLSESMETKDHHARKAEKLRWARALGMIGNEKTNARIDRWIEDYNSGREPRWVDKGETSNAAQQQNLTQSRKENITTVFKEVDRLSRKEMAMKLLLKGADPLLPKLQKIGAVDVIVFGGETVATDSKNLQAVIEKPPKSLHEESSNLVKALKASNAESIAGVVLLTDGRETATKVKTDIILAAQQLGRNKIPIFPVKFGSLLKPSDISFGELTYPEKVRRDKKAKLIAKVNTQGFEGRDMKVLLKREGEEPVEQTIKPEGPETTVEFDLDTKIIGRKEYTISTAVQEGETRDDNNEKIFAMNVVAEKVRVLLIEGEARWEFRFIDNALARDDAIDLKQVVFKQPYIGALNEGFFSKNLKLPEKADDLENSPFAEPDVVILGDVAESELTEKGWQLLERFVGESGGTLVMVAGKNHFPMEHRSLIAEALLPVTKLRPLTITGQQAEASPTERGFHLKLMPEALRESMFQFEPKPEDNQKAWASLPGHTWGLLATAKRGATVFATAVHKGKKQTFEEERENAVIVHQHYGFGQVLWLGIDSTWRWRHRVGDKYHHRFWGQVALWGATKISTTGNKFVSLRIEHSDIKSGDDAILEARWSKKFLLQHPNLKAKLQVFRSDDKDRKLPFSEEPLDPSKSRPLIHNGELINLPPGSYKIRLVVENANIGDEPLEVDLFVKEKVSKELENLSSDADLLKALANESKGEYLELDELRKLPNLITKSENSRPETPEFRIWDHWLVMLLFFALLTTEWVVRKLNGLP